MGFSVSLSIFMCLLFLLSQLHLIIRTHSSPFIQHHPLCHDDDSSALLQFKESFLINKSSSGYPLDDESACQKFASWKLELGEKSDCCSWDGVECDEDTGHVIGLNLSNGCLYGSINSNSSLFRLVHLQRLDLSYNHFNYSPIPSQVGSLSRLTHLNLSSSQFSGEIPLEISQLSHLLSLNLSPFPFPAFLESYPPLELKNPGLKSLVGNMTHLQKLDLGGVNISSTVPYILANLSSLTFLHLSFCSLHGEFPVGIFKLSNLRFLSVYCNEGLSGYLPSFTWSSPLEALELSFTSFSGVLPASMGNLGFLTELLMSDCNFSGSIPSSLGNLTKLISLYLSSNAFVGNVPTSLGNLVQLFELDISNNQLAGPVPSSIVNLPQLSFVDLSYNLLSGEIHLRLMNRTRFASFFYLRNNRLTGLVTFGPMNFTQLAGLDLSANKLHGQISNSVFKLKNLEFLDLSNNYLTGIVEFDEFVTLINLTVLDISSNQLSEFPNFLRNQHQLKYLNLSNNKIHGHVPEWVWNTSTTSLKFLDLSNNLLTGFSQHPIFLPWTSLQVLDLRSNLLQGSLPIPPVSTLHFYISNNSLNGNIPFSFCNLSSLQVLDLASNNLRGSLPRCLDNFGAFLSVLDLRRNKFHGSIPETWIRGSQLRIIMLSQNKFQGNLPRSLAKCTKLRVLDLSDNQFNDKFPSWLENHSNLEVLILRSNRFNGLMGTPQTYFNFPNLRILDISYNNFMGKLPSRLFENWKAKHFENVHSVTYIIEESGFQILRGIEENYLRLAYAYSMMMKNKGKDLFYEKVQELFIAIDFSSNRFVGEIPESVGNLKGAHLLNLSNNALTGHIPSSLRNLVEMESLDLSQNKFSGDIPQQLTQLTFLEFFNVSHNNLTGPIPQGKQFDTFEHSSFEGNPRLCGKALTRKCENSNEPPSQPSISQENQDSGSPFEFGWKIVVIGYGFGFAIGVIIGQIVIAKKHGWLMKTLRIRPPSRRRHIS